jgi:translation initiation factor 2B subunit (eIF-2B alpha/beta/delta family)
MDIRSLAENNLSGAGELLVSAARALVDELERIDRSDNGLTAERVRSTGLRLINSQPRMAPLFNLVNRVLLGCEETGDFCGKTVRRLIADYLETYNRSAEKMEPVCRSVINSGQTVCTYSRSSQVVGILSGLFRQGLSFSVVLTESRPNNEGRTTAAEFAKAGIPVTLMVDAALSEAVRLCDTAVIGADAFSSSAVINKIGSGSLALHCRKADKPLYVIASCHKLIPATVQLPAETGHPPDEVWPEVHPGIRIWNEYFETVPLDLFEGILTDRGLLDRAAVADLEGSSRISPWLIRKFGGG